MSRRTMCERAKGLLFVLVILPTTMCGWLGMAIPSFLLMRFAPSYYRWWVHVVGKFWFTHVVFLIEVVFGVRFKFYGDALGPRDSSLVISNHRTRIDWMLLWSYFLRTENLHPLRCVRSPKRACPRRVPHTLMRDAHTQIPPHPPAAPLRTSAQNRAEALA